MSLNRLSIETSPYLKQHKDNPVHWFTWGDDAFAAAQAENKPILLSIGYAACHWCHVMAHESFEDPEIAKVMNERFINVKVDREERPDVDSIYQTALQLLGEQGGWPLTMFLTPDGEPFWGGTYFPSTPRYGRPGFTQVLMSLSETFARNPDQVASNVTAIKDGLGDALTPKGGGILSLDTIDEIVTFAVRQVDPFRGGTQGAPKFPQPMFFRFLWHAYLRSGSVMFKEAVILTLDNICQGGIYDHLGGGFARYSTDDKWLVPHFEKMLYDNGLLMELLCDVYQSTESPLYGNRVEETIDWLVREMKAEIDEHGRFGFASALDADSEGEEGKYYIWDKAEIDTVLGENAAEFNEHYDVQVTGNWEGKIILNKSHSMLWDEDTESVMAPLRAKLFEARAPRVRPARDDKVLADWNGMVIAALARAGVVFDRSDWLELGRDVFTWIKDHMIADDGRLRHSMCAGKLQHPAVLEDYANLSRAALLLYEAMHDPAYLEDAKSWIEVVESHYSDPDAGGYFMAAADTTGLVARPKPIMDNAVPAGNGTMAEVLARLFLITGDDTYRIRAEGIFTTFIPEEAKQNLYHPTLLIAWELLAQGTQIVVVGDTDHEMTRALRDVALATPNRLSVVNVIDPTIPLPAQHAAAGKGLINGQPAAYVCVGPTCSLPITSANDLAEILEAS